MNAATQAREMSIASLLGRTVWIAIGERSLRGRVVYDGSRWSHPSQRVDWRHGSPGAAGKDSPTMGHREILVRVDEVEGRRPVSRWYRVESRMIVGATR